MKDDFYPKDEWISSLSESSRAEILVNFNMEIDEIMEKVV